MLLWQKYNKHVLEGIKESEDGVLEKYPFVEFDGKLRVVDIILLVPVAALLGVNVFIVAVIIYITYKKMIKIRNLLSFFVTPTNMMLFAFFSFLPNICGFFIPTYFINLSFIGEYVVVPPVMLAGTTPRIIVGPLLVGWIVAVVYFVLCVCSFRKVVVENMSNITRDEMFLLFCSTFLFLFFGIVMSYFWPPSHNGVRWAYVGIPASLGGINIGVLGMFYSVPALLNRRTIWRGERKDQQQ